MEEFIGEIRFFAFSWSAFDNWLLCSGTLVSIQQYQPLFSVIGTTYGGDGINTFALPDLGGRAAIGAGAGPGLSSMARGQKSGTEFVQLTEAQLPAHNHQVGTLFASFSPNEAKFKSQPTPGISWPSRYIDKSTGVIATGRLYSEPVTSEGPTMDPRTLAQAGGSAAHDNRQPYLPLSAYICFYGTWPSPANTDPEAVSA